MIRGEIMKSLFDYSIYDNLHRELVNYYGSEIKLRHAIIKHQHPIKCAAIYGAAIAGATKALREFGTAVGVATREVGKINIVIDSRKYNKK